MVGTRKETTVLLEPQNPVYFVSEDNVAEIDPVFIKPEIIGEKAYGLSCLPEHWTLPFIVISETLFSDYRNSSNEKREKIIEKWNKQIVAAANYIGISEDDQIIVRSSGCSEGMIERGQLYSVDGSFSNLNDILNNCLRKLSQDEYLSNNKVPLIIQRYINPISSKGHLSNERRCYEEKRDWLGEFDDTHSNYGHKRNFEITLRNWRKKIETKNYTDKPLACNLLAHISEVLKIPAAWAYERNVRIHYEWVWDGRFVYIVQADQELKYDGVDPTKLITSTHKIPFGFVPKCLKEPSKEHAQKYQKVRNIFTYTKLGLPVAKLYILDDQKVIENLALGHVSEELKSDILQLVKGSLVIRMDIATDDLNTLQLLPRTQEERDLNSALDWLKKRSAEIKKSVQEDVAFLFHNFIPAVSSAFAYAAPGERKVQIEALWGLPEGLYYNAHDKYIVDTKTPRIDDLNREQFEISEKRKFKHFFITPDDSGRWIPKILKPPYDWKGSIQKDEWIKDIAYESRRIAEEEGKSLSVMWFVNVPESTCRSKVFPWHHEYYDPEITTRARSYRTKTPFDKSFVIKTSNDIDILRQEAMKKHSNIRRIRIMPNEDNLLRDKKTLSKIGELAKEINAVILMEGGVLSHAYYQLMQTNAIVEVLHPFNDSEDKREFNKLVRDKISHNIEQRGEIVNIARLSGDYLLRALKEKLVEEAFEVLDAIDQESIINELADVSEVVDGILSHINVTNSELEKRQAEKREKAGGFKDGIVLLETRNPLPTTKRQPDPSLFEEIEYEGSYETVLDQQKIIDQSHKIDKWSDKREHQSSTETILNITIPMVLDKWFSNTAEKVIDPDNNIKVLLEGKRLGCNIQIQLSVFTTHKEQVQQLLLFNPFEVN